MLRVVFSWAGDGRGIPNDIYTAGYPSAHLMTNSTYPASSYTAHLSNPAATATQLVSQNYMHQFFHRQSCGIYLQSLVEAHAMQ